jgi:carboxylate-amine ligase
MLDIRQRRLVPARAVLEEIVEWTSPARDQLGLDVSLPELNGAQRARNALAAGEAIEEIYKGAVEETKRTYVVEEVASGR